MQAARWGRCGSPNGLPCAWRIRAACRPRGGGGAAVLMDCPVPGESERHAGREVGEVRQSQDEDKIKRTPKRPFYLRKPPGLDQARALIAADRRLLWRAALFLWMICLSATRSITAVALRKT